MKIACIFPGQGAQKLGMGFEIYQNFRSARIVFDEANEVLKRDLSEIIFKGPEEALSSTENTQVALMVTSIAMLRILELKLGKKLHEFCAAVAGHSLGEFTALVASGALAFSDCVRLLALRGKAMQEAVPSGKGGMFALLGGDIEVASKIAKEAGIDVANDNAPSQQVLSGEMPAVLKAIEMAESLNYKTVKLNVSGPFHSKLMDPAKAVLEKALNEIKFNEPEVDVISNFTGEIMRKDDIKNNLLLQLTNTVKWCDSIKTLKKQGVKTVLEVGPGRIYTNLNKRIDQELDAFALNDEASINLFVESFEAKAL